MKNPFKNIFLVSGRTVGPCPVVFQLGGVAPSCDPCGGEAGEVVVFALCPVRPVDGKSSSIPASTVAAPRRWGRHGG